MSSTARWSLRTRVTALCATAAIVLALIAASAAVAAVNSRSELNDVFNRIGPMRTNTDQLVTTMLNEETGVRGYAVNGTDADLAPYTDGLKQEQQIIAQLTTELSTRPSIAAELRDVQAKIDAWHAAVADPVITRVRSGDRPGALTLIDTHARDLFNGVRASLTRLQNSIVSLRDASVDRLTKSSNEIVRLLIAAAVVVLLAGVLLAFLLRYLVTRPVADLAGEVRRIAAGDYNHTVDTGGPPELAALGRDVDGMRRQIVADLDEVRAARGAIEEANRQLEAQTAELTRSNRDLEQFAYVASHDLQEPLRKVASFCQLLQRRYAGQLDERADQYIGFAVDGAQRMQRLINDLLAFSRIGRITSEFTDVDLNAVVAESAAQTEAAVTRAGGSITWDPLPVVRGEESLLTALIGNLVNNSVKFRQPDVAPRVHLSAHRRGDEWEIECRDNGIGIEAEFADKVFVIFQRLHVKGAYPGTGIGLAIAKKIVEYHGGQIWLDTSVEEGTTIRFTLPIENPADAGAVSPVSPAQAPITSPDPTKETVS
ncbi:sensor histidine kinase [Rugosimonospora africana]|uniref:histidine kinase n=1 Tax=Rugosimonospora africana TaxID=556532 RepID=A0A8J3QZT0_9ACTN|nr:ATP-binding protein [Rugosimonospora africana]GIH20355.1 histidine kinase [Rugosimonospora africana]